MKRMEGWVITAETYTLPERFGTAAEPARPMALVNITMPQLRKVPRKRKPQPVPVSICREVALHGEAWKVLCEMFVEAGASVSERARCDD